MLNLDDAGSIIKKQERKDKVHNVMDLVDMSHRKYEYLASLSGGEKQRVAISRAVIHQPQILFADEPTASLDSKRSNEVMKLIRELTSELGITTLMVTHAED